MISIIIPNWNGRKFLGSCLASLREQTYRDFEILLVDNGSDDGSEEYVKHSFPEVRILRLERNRGFAVAVNIGIQNSRKEFVALLNNDTWTDALWLEELVKGIVTCEKIGFCASKILQAPGGKQIDTAGDGYTPYGLAYKRGNRQPASRFMDREFVFGACAAAALYRRSMFEKIGFFDESFGSIYEDVDLSFRAQLGGYKCLYVPTAIVYHFVGGTAGTKNYFTVYQGQRNLEAVWLKNMPARILLKNFLFHVLYNLFALGYNLAHQKGIPFLRGKFNLMKEIASILQKRKKIQSTRKIAPGYVEKIMDQHSLFHHLMATLRK